MSDQLEIVLIAAAWAGGVGAIGLCLAWVGRHLSLRWLTAGVSVVAVAAVLAGLVGTARAMFISEHDFVVVLWVAAVAGIVALVVAMAVGEAFAHWSRSLRDDARTLGDHGRLDASTRGPSEFRALADELAATSVKLAESRDREARLENSRRELISWVSHDLRTPLAGIRAMTEALEDGLAEDPTLYQRRIGDEVERMVRMVDDLFELSRIHAGVLRLHPEPVGLGDLISEAIAGADPLARERGIRLGGSVEDGVSVTADPTALSRVVANLVINAIRHTPPDGSVEINGRSVPGGIEVSVTDECGGLVEEEMARVFDVAWQAEPARTPSTGAIGSGAGLGLAIVKGIVEAHDGNVRVENKPPGCRFLVQLPM